MKGLNYRKCLVALDTLHGHYPLYIEWLRTNNYSASVIRVVEKIVPEYLDFLAQQPHQMNNRDILCSLVSVKKFNDWKIGCRQNKTLTKAYLSKLRKWILKFEQWRSDQPPGDLRASITAYIDFQKPFFRYKRQGIELKNLLLSYADFTDGQGLPMSFDDFFEWKNAKFYANRKSFAKAHIEIPLNRFYTYLNLEGVAKTLIESKPEPLRFQLQVNEYLRYCEQDRGLSKSSLGHNFQILSLFDQHLCNQGINRLKSVRLNDIDNFITKRFSKPSRKLCSRSAEYAIVSGFCKYLFMTGRHAKDLSEQIVCPRKYRLEKVPHHLSKREVAAVFERLQADNTDLGLRDRAMVNIIFYQGLRIGEVTAMTLDDIDWESRVLTVATRKNG